MSGSRKWLRIALLAAVAAILAYGLFLERHAVFGLLGGPARDISGAELTEAATRDGLMIQAGRLSDSKSLSPALADEKDCKT